jgi:SAM-dependent methyltransferase
LPPWICTILDFCNVGVNLRIKKNGLPRRRDGTNPSGNPDPIRRTSGPVDRAGGPTMPVTPFKTFREDEIQRINRIQRNLFDKLYQLFEPPLPEGVPERLEKIVAHGKITVGDTVLDVGTGTGILIPIIMKYKPRRIHACDLSETMIEQLNKNYPHVETIVGDVRDLRLPDSSIDVVFINACYPNIVDKAGAFSNISRMMKAEGRIVISHPLGKAFILSLIDAIPFPLDEFPEELEADALLKPFGFEIETFIDEPKLYILVVTKRRFGDVVDEAE